MYTELYWPGCKARLMDATFGGQDAYFVTCSLEEAERQLFPRLTHEQIRRCTGDYDPEPKEGIPSDKICALVAVDLSVISAQPWWFPYAGQWNAYSPFRAVEEKERESLEDLMRAVR